MKTKRYLMVVMLLVLSLSTTGCSSNTNQKNTEQNQNISFDYEPYKDIKTMQKAAGMIFQGTVVKVYPAEEQVMGYSEENGEGPTYFPFTVSEIKVENAIKGDIKIGDLVKVRQFGGTINGTRTYCEGVTLLTEGEQGIFFTDSTIIDPNGPPTILLLDQGVFKIKNGKLNINRLQEGIVESTKPLDLINTLETQN